MMQNNLFNSTEYLLHNYFLGKFPVKDISENIMEGIKSVRTYFDSTLKRLHTEKYKPILMRPPFQWA